MGASASRASAKRRRCPVESRRTGSSASGSRPSASSAASTSPPPPCSRAAKARLSRAVSAGFSASWGERKRSRRACSARSASASAPSQSSAPAAGGSSPASSRSRLDLPAPFAPVSSSAAPGATPERHPGEDHPLAPQAGELPRFQHPPPSRGARDGPPVDRPPGAVLENRPYRSRLARSRIEGLPDHADDRAGQPEDPPHPDGGRQDLQLLQPARGGQEHRRHLPPALQPEGAAGERAALRGRPLLHGGGREGDRRTGCPPATPRRRCRSARPAS